MANSNRLKRYKNPIDLAHDWQWFSDGLRYLATNHEIKYDEVILFQQLIHFVTREENFVGMIFDSEGNMSAFCAMIEDTLPFAKERSHECLVFFHDPSQNRLTRGLQKAYEHFAREAGFSYYVVPVFGSKIKSTTRRCFTGKPYKFQEHSYNFRRKI